MIDILHENGLSVKSLCVECGLIVFKSNSMVIVALLINSIEEPLLSTNVGNHLFQCSIELDTSFVNNGSGDALFCKTSM